MVKLRLSNSEPMRASIESVRSSLSLWSAKSGDTDCGVERSSSTTRPSSFWSRTGSLGSRAANSLASLDESLITTGDDDYGDVRVSLATDATGEVQLPVTEENPALDLLARVLYVHYMCLGWVNSFELSTAFAYCYYVKAGQANTCTALPSFFQLAWTFKFFFGAITDSTPVFGMNRVPYLIGGWAVKIACCVYLAFYANGMSMLMYAGTVAVSEMAMVMADCAADAIIVGVLSRREPVDRRGSTLASSYMFRFASGVISSSLVAVLYNGPDSGGTFSWGLDTQQIWWVALAPPAAALIFVFPYLREPTEFAPAQKKTFFGAVGEFYEAAKQPALYRFGITLFSVTALCLVTNAAQSAAGVAWYDQSNLQTGVDNTVSYVMLSVVVYLYKRYLLGTSWRKVWWAAITGMQSFELLYLTVIWVPVLRNGWYYITIDLDSGVAYDLTFIIGVIAIPELVTPGLEGITMGGITTLTNCAEAIANAISIQLLGVWNVSSTALEEDAHDVKMSMTKLQFVCCFLALLPLLLLQFFPDQKEDCKRLKALPESAWGARVVCSLIAVGMIYGTCMAVLPVVPSMQCLQIAGGQGCPKHSEDA